MNKRLSNKQRFNLSIIKVRKGTNSFPPPLPNSDKEIQSLNLVTWKSKIRAKSTTAKKLTFVNSISGLTPPPSKGSIKAARDYLARPPSQTVQVGQRQGSQGLPGLPTQPDCTGRAALRQPASTWPTHPARLYR
jgi:hypothetical protein